MWVRDGRYDLFYPERRRTHRGEMQLFETDDRLAELGKFYLDSFQIRLDHEA